MKSITTLLICSVSIFSQSAKFDANEFIKRVRSSYHSFEIDTTQKISSFLTTQSFNTYFKSKTTENIDFPVSIDWSNIAAISVDRRKDVLGTSDFKERQDDVLTLSSFFLQSWLDFSVNELIPQQAINYSLSQKGKRVYFSYISQNGKSFDRVAKEFALNGLLLDMSIQTGDHHTLKIQPIYRSIQGKYLCVGWSYQKIDKNSNVVEGMIVDLVQKQIGKNWYPYDVRLTIQTLVSKKEPTLEQLFFRNYHLQGDEIK